MKETEIQKEKSRRTVRGELALMVAVAINSLGVVRCCIPAQASRQYQACRMHFPKFSHAYRLEPGLIYFRDFWC